MKRNITMLIAAFSIIAMANSQAMAASYDLDLEEDMAEGITLSTPAEVKVYKYDNSIPDPGELMGEGIIFAVEQKDEKEYVGDASMPSMHNLIGEGICLEGKSGLIAVK